MYNIRTFQFRVKDSGCSALLSAHSKAVNFVWNFCNETTKKAWNRDYRWLSTFVLSGLTAGTSKDLHLHSQTIQAICEEHGVRRGQFHKAKLGWRTIKRSLGWVPFKISGIKVKGDKVFYQGHWYAFWKSREIEGTITSGSFSQDAQGHWFVNFQCRVPTSEHTKNTACVGIDLGLKDIAVPSSGFILPRENMTNKYAKKLATAQRAHKKRLVTKIHARIKNSRKDWAHKQTTALVKQYGKIFVGNVSVASQLRGKNAKSVSDAGWSGFKSMLAYKAITLGVDFKVVDEKYTTVTCSSCLERTGPTGVKDLGVREWTCSSCGTFHLRDVNAAKNILAVGLGATLAKKPILGSSQVVSRNGRGLEAEVRV